MVSIRVICLIVNPAPPIAISPATVHGSSPALLLQSADTATGIGGSFQLRGMGVSDPSNFESHLFQCHLPIVKQRVTMLTKMRVQLAPWVVRTARAATTTELAALARFL